MMIMRALLVTTGIVASIAACGGNTGQDLDPTPHNSPAFPAGPMAAGASVADILENPSRFLGTPVTISGEVTEVWAPRAFAIGGDAFLDSQRLVVVSREDLPRIVARAPHEALSPTDIVQLSGTLHVGSLENVEREVGFNLPAAAEELWKPQQPVFVAESVIVTPRRTVNP